MRAFSPEKIPVPPDFRALAIIPGVPLDVEIGCGVGFHPIKYANANPQRQLVAIERTKDKFEKFAARLKNHEVIKNLIPIHGDAIAWVSHGVAANSVDRFFTLYPNPYPKESQRNLRFHNMPFFAHLLHCLKVGGEYVLATNKEFYATEAERVLVAEWGMGLIEKRQLDRAETPRTHFEKKYLLRGEACWSLVFKKLPQK